MAPASEGQPSSEASAKPVDGGTLLPPSNATEGGQPTLSALNSADSSLLSDTSHVQQLINHGADVNAPDNNGWTPLHTAAYHGQEEIVRILLGANANVNARNRTEETPLHLAAKWPQDRVVEALLAGGADLAARSKRGRTPAHVAALFNRHAILDRLLSAGADVNAVDCEMQTPLHLAVRANCPVEPELVKTLIRHNADLEIRDTKGNAPLHFLPCAQVGDWLHWAAYEGKESLMSILLAKPGVRPDCYSEEGLTPLHLAAHVNSTNMVTMLLNAGAKVNAPSQPPTKASGKDTTYGIPLPGAPGSITAGISISSQLKAYGSSKLPPGELTALHIAAERGSAELIRVLVAAGAKVNVQGERGMPPLHVAVWEGNTAAVVSLLAAKASVSLKSKAGGFTSVHCACLSSRATPELLALLLDNGGAAVIEERCQEGWTALHLACQSAPPAMVELLLQRGARPGAKGKNGRTAADCAAKRPEILQILHVATGGKVPLPLGLSSMAAAANGLLVPNGSAAASGGGASGLGGGGGSAGGGSARGGGGGAAAGSGGASGGGRGRSGSTAGRGGAAGTSSSSSSSQSGLLPGTAAVLEPLESVEATLAALLADMGGALCSLQAGAVFGAGACAVDPVGHCIRPLDKRLVMVCTLGCHFSFHLQCWMSAREVLKERWTGFTGSLAAGGKYCCIAPGCPGYIREQSICDGTQMQSSNQSRLYQMPHDMYDSLPPQAKPIGGGVPSPPGAGDSCIPVAGGVQQSGTAAQPALPAGGGGSGLPSLAALAPSLTLAQAMVQAATAVGNMVGGSARIGTSQLAAALAAGGLPALLAANPPPVPQAMSAREAAAIAAQTLGMTFGGSGGASGSGSGASGCVVEEVGSEDENEDEDYFAASANSPGSSGAAGANRSSGGAPSSSMLAASRSSGVASTSSSGAANGGGRKHGGGGGGGGGSSSSARRAGKGGGGGKALGGKTSSSSPISNAAAVEMLQQLQGLQQAVAAVQSAVGAGVHSMGLVGGTGGTASSGGQVGGGGGAAAAAAALSPPAAVASDESAAAAATSSSTEPVAVAVLEPPPEHLLPLVAAASCSSDDLDGKCCGPTDDTAGGGLQDAAPMPPPRRRNTPMPPNPRRAPQPLSCNVQDNGRQPVSPQLATPPPATSLLTPGVQQLLPPAASGSAAAAVLRQLPSSLAPILVGPVPQLQLQPPAGSGATSVAASVPAAASCVHQGTASGKTRRQLSSSGTAVTRTGSGAEGPEAVAPAGDAAVVASCSSLGPAATAVANGMDTKHAGNSASATADPPSSAAGGSAVSRASPRRSGGGVGGASPSSASAGSAKSEFLAAIANGQAAAAAYGGRVTLTAPGLSIGFVRGVPLATTTTTATSTTTVSVTSANGSSSVTTTTTAATAGSAAGPAATPGLTVARSGPGKAGGPGGPPLNPANFEPGGYARAVCPGLRPGVHRVTHSSGRVPPPPGATVVPASVVNTAAVVVAAVDESPDVGASERAAAAAALEHGKSGPGLPTPSAEAAEEPPQAAHPAAAKAVQGSVKAKGERLREQTDRPQPSSKAESGGAAVGPTAAVGAEQRAWDPVGLTASDGTAAAAVTAPAAPVPGAPALAVEPSNAPSVAAVTEPQGAAPTANSAAAPAPSAEPVTPLQQPTQDSSHSNAAVDIVRAALHGLRACSAAGAAPSAAAVASVSSGVEVAADAPAAAAAVHGSASSASSRHLLLESGDIPLLAGTPGMLEAWLSAHVGTHGRLVAHRILAPQAAVAVTLESDSAAVAAAQSLRQRPNLLVQPLSVAPLVAFPEDEVLADSAQRVAKARSAPGDRSWMRHMVQLWEQLQGLPPATQYE